MKKLLRIFAVFIILLSIAFAYWGKKFIWYRVSGAKITFDHKEVPESILYRSFNGDYVLLIRYDGEEKALYVIRPGENQVGVQSRLKFTKLPFCLVSFEYPVYPITGDSEKGASTNPNLLIEDGTLRFTIFPNREINVAW